MSDKKSHLDMSQAGSGMHLMALLTQCSLQGRQLT